ncbi:MAG: FAD-dependent oxidoreductase, partial [Candidatus Dormibacteria bacterium]
MEPEATPSRLRLLLRPGALGSLRLPHRVVMGAMHLGFESRQGGGAAMAAFYGARARAGAGLMVTGGAAVSREGAGGRNYGRLDADEDRRLFAEAAAEVHRQGGLIALQLFHAGRYASPQAFGLQPVAPSAVYSRYSRCEPRALSPKEVEGTLEDFSRGAGWARRLGFDAVEVMGSEGYLVDQFLSPLTNLRTDDFGGDPPRRRRFGLEVLARVRQAVGSDFPVIFRFTGWDLMPGGTPRRESLDFAQELARAGADALNVGIGWHESPVPTVQALVPPGAWTGVAARVKRAVGEVPVMAGTRINRLLEAERILAATGIDFVSMARPFLADPELMEKARSGRAVNVCIACNQACIDRSLDDRAVSCMVNPRAGHESEPESPTVSGPAASPGMPRLRLAVVGAGPAGLEAARDLALLGHRVELFEASSSLGGQFLLARRVPGKADFGSTVAYFGAELSRLGVRVHLRRQIGAADQVLLAGYDGLVVATGVRPRPVDIPISGTPRILSYPEAFAKGALEGRVAVVGGGGIGVDIAHLASHGEEAGKGIAR